MNVVEKPRIISAKFSEDDILLIDEVCQANAEDRSSFIRRSVRRELARLNYYPDPVKKALGIKPQNGKEAEGEVRNP